MTTQEEITKRVTEVECPCCGNPLSECHQRQWFGEHHQGSYIETWFACDHCEVTFTPYELFLPDMD